jgi:hypothetical protein
MHAAFSLRNLKVRYYLECLCFEEKFTLNIPETGCEDSGSVDPVMGTVRLQF